MRAAVHVHPKVQRRLTAMESRPNAPATAARRARQIIDRLARGEPLSLSGRMSSKNDQRVKNSLKFNLGQGFRLICIRGKGIISVVFIGNHDNADTWLYRNTRKRSHKNGLKTNRLPEYLPAAVYRPRQENHHARDETWGQEEIAQDMLRRIFRGLCTKA